MNKNERYPSIVWTAAGLYFAFEGYQLGMGTFKNPGCGFLIFWAGIILAGLSLLLLIQTFFSVDPKKEKQEIWEGLQWHKGIYMMVSLVIYALVIKWLGFILSSFGLILFLSKSTKSQKWAVALSFSAITIAVCYIVFVVLLEVQLPQGILNRLFSR